MTSGDTSETVDEPRDGPPRLTGAQLNAINRFPDDNPNPVLRMDDEGLLIYANPASRPVHRPLSIVARRQDP